MTEVQVFLVRHGETALNAAGVLRGQLDVPLDATGEAEALALGALFREVPLSAVVSSPLRRATDTARPIASSSGAPVEIDDRLRDRYYGKWAGHSLEQVEERFGSVDAVPFVEARRLLEARVEEAFLDAIAAGAARSPRGTPSEAQQLGVVLVTHDAVIRTLLGRLLPALNLATVDLPTGSWTQLVSTPTGGWEALHLGEIPTSGRRPTLSA